MRRQSAAIPKVEISSSWGTRERESRMRKTSAVIAVDEARDHLSGVCKVPVCFGRDKTKAAAAAVVPEK